jgi:hypothetical protein
MNSYNVKNVQRSCSAVSCDGIYTNRSHVRGYNNIVLALQSSTDSLHILPGSSNETSSDCTDDVGNITVDDDVVVIEERFIAVNKQADIGIKQEEIPKDINFPDIKAEPDEVSYVCICVLLDTFCGGDFHAIYNSDGNFDGHNEQSRVTYRIS